MTVKPGFQWVPPGVRGSRVMRILHKGGVCIMQGKGGNKEENQITKVMHIAESKAKGRTT